MGRCLLLFVWLWTAVPAQAQPSLYASGGVSAPVLPETFSDLWTMGWGVEGGFGGFGLGNAELFAGIEYNRFPINADEWLTDAGANADVTGGEATVLGGHIRALLFLSGAEDASIIPFVEVGLGVQNFSIADLSASVGPVRESVEGDSNIAGVGLAGFGILIPTEYAISPFLSIRASYLLDDGDDEVFIPIRAGFMLRR